MQCGTVNFLMTDAIQNNASGAMGRTSQTDLAVKQGAEGVRVLG